MRSAPPPDFRYVGLRPAPTRRHVRRWSVLSGFSAFGVSLGLAHDAASLGTVAAAGLAGMVTAWITGRTAGLGALDAEAVQVPLAILPWGVLIHADDGLRVLRWAAVRQVDVRLVCTKDEATPITRYSLVTIRTERELFAGRASGTVSLERLEAHLESYASEAGRPLASDLEGRTALGEDGEASVELLLARARRLLGSDELVQRLRLPAAGYRRLTGAGASEQARAELERVLTQAEPPFADARPLAAILAAELSITALREPVAALSACPHPVVAAVSRAAALRLGADLARIGALEELTEFVPGEELDELRRWAGVSAAESR